MEAIGRLAGGVAHDFNNLLTAISGYTNLVLDRLRERDSDVVDDVSEIDRAAQRAHGLTRQLLAFSRKQVLQPQVLELNDVVGDMDGMLRRLIGENIEVVTAYGVRARAREGRPRAARAGDPEPRGERARRDARRRHADDRDGERRSYRRGGRATRRRGRTGLVRDARRSATPDAAWTPRRRRACSSRSSRRRASARAPASASRPCTGS